LVRSTYSITLKAARQFELVAPQNEFDTVARDQLSLNGALLLDLWFYEPHRPTRDVDFLRFGPAEIPRLEETFRTICGINVTKTA
jgi:hypothetical protein